MNCDWQPTHNVYTGTAKAAIMSYADIPLYVRKTLIERANRNDYDDTIEIGRNSITGRNQYEPDITQMHFGGKGKVCATVSYAKWSERDRQRAMVYCEGSYCVARPSVCNNWSRVVRIVAKAENEEQPITEFGPIYDAEPPAETMPDVRSFSDSVPVSGVSYNSQGSWGLDGPAGSWLAPPRPLPVIPSPIPEPSTWLCMLAGLGLLAMKGKAK